MLAPSSGSRRLVGLLVSGVVILGACGSSDGGEAAVDEGTTVTTASGATDAQTSSTSDEDEAGTTASSSTASSTSTSTSTTNPTSSSTSRPPSTPPPGQRVVANSQAEGDTTLTGDTAITSSAWGTSFSFEALDTGLPVQLTSVENPSSCAPGSNATLGINSGLGEHCEIRVQVDGSAGFPPADYVFTIDFIAREHVDWSIASGPPLTGCFEPGTQLDDLVVRGANNTLEQFDVYFIVDGQRGSFAGNQLEISGPTSTGESQSWSLRVSTSATEGRIGLLTGFSIPGNFINTTNPPVTFEWDIKADCSAAAGS